MFGAPTGHPQVKHRACGVATDQRDISRPQGGRCDMGAFEVLAAVASRSPTPALPRAGDRADGPSTGLFFALVGFGIMSVLVLARAAATRRPLKT